MARCLVTGASGYIGRALVPALVAAGHVVRAQRHRADVPGPAQESFCADLSQGFPESALEDIDTVFHLAGLAHSRETPAAYRTINVEATVSLARAAMAAGVRRLVFLSSVKAALAAAAPATADDYARSKADAETALLSLAQGGAMDVFIVRPALVYGGEHGGYLRWLERWVQAHLPAPPEGGERAMVAREDLVRLLVMLQQACLASPATLTLTDGQSYSAQRLHRALCDARGLRPWLPSPPPAVWKLACRVGDLVSGQAAGASWRRLQGAEPHRGTDLDALLGFRIQRSFEDVVRGAGGVQS